MEPTALLEALHIAGRLKDTTRHCYSSQGRHESVAEHSWRLALMAYFMKDQLPHVDMQKVIAMCLIHDLGEAFTGDIPVFDKTEADEAREEALLFQWVETLPAPLRQELMALYQEMAQRKSEEARVYKALDGLEAIIAHNESPLSTWEDHEYQLQMTYADDRVGFSPYLAALREAIRQETVRKVKEGQ